MTASDALTPIEIACRTADAEEGLPGYHVRLVYPDGSYLDAPVLQAGPNWAQFAELTAGPLTVDTTDARVEIDYQPGPAEAFGPRFSHIDKRHSAPTAIEQANQEITIVSSAYGHVRLDFADGSFFEGTLSAAAPDVAFFRLEDSRRVEVPTAGAEISMNWHPNGQASFGGQRFEHLDAAGPAPGL